MTREETMAKTPGGMLVVWLDFPTEKDHQVNDWYNHEHVISRVVLPGFFWGKRFVAVEGSPRYLAIYGTESLDVLSSDDYVKAIANPDAAEAENVMYFYNGTRALCEVVASAGQWEGGIVGVLGVSGSDGQGDALGAWLGDQVLPALVKEHGVPAARLLRSSQDAVDAASCEFTPDDVRPPDWILVAEATTPEAMAAARQAHLSTTALRAHGAANQQHFGIYRMLLRVEE
jgi:hypothetical protein